MQENSRWTRSIKDDVENPESETFQLNRKNEPNYNTPSDYEIYSKSEKKKDSLKRDQWSGKLDFIFSCIGYAIGNKNI